MPETGFWWILLSLVFYGSLHSSLASLWFKAWVERRIGSRRFHRFYRLFFNGMAALTLLPSLALVLLLPNQPLYTIRPPWLILTGFLQLMAVFGLLAGVAQTGGANFLGLEQFFQPEKASQPRKFVRTGLYHWVRHPLYFFALIFIWLLPVMSWNTLAWNIGASLYLTIGSLFEEKKLLQEFGEKYTAYRHCTPMFIPGLRLKPPCTEEELEGR
ncbi:MAG: isoprenylcysteine carboxylmethyltransferase family protein [Anaerolineaceae bacterium]|nr:isoprenylcysteine carboxylmethyltransferase family protein [Anaerolineaceae bacterium]